MKLNNMDLVTATVRMPYALRSLMKEFPETVVAGGFIRSCITNEPISDIDVFAQSEDRAALLATRLSCSEQGAAFRITRSPNALTVHTKPFPVQFITRWTYERPEDVVPSFDFTISKAAFWYRVDGEMGRWESLCDDRYYHDLAAKRLVYTSPIRNEDAGGTMLRILKFYQRGYRVPLDSLGAVIGRLMTGVKGWERIGMDEDMLSKVITGLLVEVDPMVDPEHLAHLGAERVEEKEAGNDE